MAHEYLTAEELKATLELTGQTFADNDIELARKAATRAIEGVCNRRFWLDPDANQTRYYTPARVASVAIDDLTELTTVKADQDGDGTFEETWTENTDFVLEPLNAAADGEPWRRIRIDPNGTRLMPSGAVRSLEVTGQFGWPEVPDAIKEATGILAAKILRRAREAPFGIITTGIEVGAIMRIARQDPDVSFLIDQYVRQLVLLG
jgi:hypothetical protein